MKRLIVRTICICMLASLLLFSLSLTGPALAGGGVTVSVSDVSARAGGQVEVDVSIANNPGFGAFTFDITYDAALLTPVSVEANINGMFVYNLAYDSNTVRATYANGNNITDNGVLYTVVFSIKSGAASNAVSDLILNVVTLRNTANANVSSSVTEGSVTVLPPPVRVTGVSLNKTATELQAGQTEKLTATVLPANAENKAVNWSSNKTAVASVDSTGKITAKAPGSAVITVTTQDGNKKATCTVTVVPKPPVKVTGVTLNNTALALQIGQSQTLTASVMPANATNKAVTWKSSDTQVVTVDASGKVTALKSGTARITVTTVDGSKTAECTVTVSAPPATATPVVTEPPQTEPPQTEPPAAEVTGVTLSKTELELEVGKTYILIATVEPKEAQNRTVTWSSSDGSIVTVDSSGKLTALKTGTATITVTTQENGKTAVCTVTVTDKQAREPVWFFIVITLVIGGIIGIGAAWLLTRKRRS